MFFCLDGNQAPIANAGGDQIVILPADLVVLNGSRSTDDRGIVSYKWTMEASSPAAGVMGWHYTMLHLNENANSLMLISCVHESESMMF
jgi:hypothetical protein